MKVYIDTNWFLGLLEENSEPKSALVELRGRAAGLLLTDQTRMEFARNWDRIVRTLRDNVRNSLQVRAPYSVSVLRELDEFQALKETRRSLDNAGKALLRRIDSWLADPRQEPVFAAFEDIAREASVLTASAAAVARAHVRKLRGRPPSSSKRTTIGDEIIWECLLESCDDDLCIVTNDGDFLQHRKMLQDEYRATTGRSLRYLDKKLTGALELLGEPSPAIEGLEKARESLEIDPASSCRKCGANAWLRVGIDEEDNCSVVFVCEECGHEIAVS